jgi:hypothetical protein
MTFQFKVYYQDDSRFNYGKMRHKVIRARSKVQAMEKFKKAYGIEPADAE